MITIPGKIPVRIRPIFWITIAILGIGDIFSIQDLLLWIFVCFLSVLIHEYGHALTAVFFKRKASIELVGLGGIAQYEGQRLNFLQEFILILNGPLAGFLLSFLFYCIKNILPESLLGDFTGYFLYMMIYINLYLSIFNMLPVYPLDGGRLFKAVLELLFGDKGGRAAFLSSSLFGATLALWAYIQISTFTAFLLASFAYESYQAWCNETAPTTPLYPATNSLWDKVRNYAPFSGKLQPPAQFAYDSEWPSNSRIISCNYSIDADNITTIVQGVINKLS
jgi:Zn-dependent protease